MNAYPSNIIFYNSYTAHTNLIKFCVWNGLTLEMSRDTPYRMAE